MQNSLFSYKKFWAHRFGNAAMLPMSQEEMQILGWDSCDIIIVSGDAYIDHPSFGAAVIGRVLEAQGFRVGIIAQPDLSNPQCMQILGKPNLYFAVSAGNMDSMINHYTSDNKKRHNDAYTPNDAFGKRPDRAVIKYTQAIKTVYKDLPVIIGGIEASLRRLAHYDYWSDKVRRSVLIDSKADLLIYGNAERAIVEISHRIASNKPIIDCFDIRGIAFIPSKIPDDFAIIDASNIDKSGVISKLPQSVINSIYANPYETDSNCDYQGDNVDNVEESPVEQELVFGQIKANKLDRRKTVINLPSFEAITHHPDLYAHTNRIFHLETNPGNARHLMQLHDGKRLWATPPPIPLTTAELDAVFALPFSRIPHPSYNGAKITAYEMIKNSVNIMRGCFGGCTFCSITEHEGRIIQSRSEQSILAEIEHMKTIPGFAGVVSDLGGPTANMYRLGCKSKEIEESCRKLSCVYPSICSNLDTNHQPLIELYRNSRKIKGIKRIFVASGVRYDLAVQSPEYVKELVTHHVGGYLKIAPEHTEAGPLQNMMKPGIDSYYKFKELFEKSSREAGKEQYLIPYFIAAHPGTTDVDMMNLAIWLKKNDFRADQVQAFLPSPMSIATAMWYTGYSPLKGLKNRHKVASVKDIATRKLHKAFLRYHDPENWELLREALTKMGRADLIGNSKSHLIPTYTPKLTKNNQANSQNKAVFRAKTGSDFKKDYKKDARNITNPNSKSGKTNSGSKNRNILNSKKKS